MKNSKISFMLLVLVGVIGVAFRIYSYLNGAEFNSYFWSDFLGIALVTTALVNAKKKKI